MKKLPHIIILLFLFFTIYSCEPHVVEQKINWQSMEVFVINGKNDTVNCLDGSGLKQGKWIPSPLNDLKDTVFYFNDSLIKK